MKELAKTDYSFYLEYVHKGTYFPYKPHKLICDKLQKVEQGDINKLMIFMPPRHGKSFTISESFASWFIGKDPRRRVIETSYSDRLAKKFGRRNREKIMEYGHELFGVTLSPEKTSVQDWEVANYKGGMISAPLGGPITGEGADLLVIDDPIKNRKEADSATFRENVWDEWQNTLLTRLSPTGAVIIIMTRWHEDDLCGRLLVNEPEDWEIIKLPAEAEEGDMLEREEGEPLFPERGYNLEWLQKKKHEVGSRAYKALYQQRPSPEEGGILKRHWWQFYSKMPEIERFDEIIQSWDMAFKDKDDSSYVVGQVWGRIGADKYLLDQTRDKLDFTESVKAVKQMTSKWGDSLDKWGIGRAKLIEDKANGPAVINTLNSEIGGIIPVAANSSDKVGRAHAVAPDVEAGNVYLPSPHIAPWINDFIEECTAFPNSSYDDQVDACTQALDRLINNPAEETWEIKKI